MIIYTSSLRITSYAIWKLQFETGNLSQKPLWQTPSSVMLNHLKPPSFYWKKDDGTFPWPDTMRPIFLTWSRRAAVAINDPENRAGWWRIEEEIEVKRSRSQDLERGRGCDQFFSTLSPGHVGDTKSAWRWPGSLESKSAFSSTRSTILKVKGPQQTGRVSYFLFI